MAKIFPFDGSKFSLKHNFFLKHFRQFVDGIDLFSEGFCLPFLSKFLIKLYFGYWGLKLLFLGAFFFTPAAFVFPDAFLLGFFQAVFQS